MDKILSVKIKSGMKNCNHCEFKNKLNLGDYKQMAILLNDLERHGAKINKAYDEFKKGNTKFPW